MLGLVLITQVLIATAAFAIPTSKERLAQRVARRAAGAHLTSPKQTVVRTMTSETGELTNVTHPEFSSNWAGAVLVAGAVCHRSIITARLPLYFHLVTMTSSHTLLPDVVMGVRMLTCPWGIFQNTFKSVTGTFVVPTPREPSGGSGTHSASAWVGIDGDTCGTAILQTGIDFTVSGTRTSFDGPSLLLLAVSPHGSLT